MLLAKPTPLSLRLVFVPLFLSAFILCGLSVEPSAAQNRPAWADSIYSLIESDLQRLVDDQKAYFSKHQTYALDLGTLGCESSRGVTMGVAASEDGFSAVAFHEALGTTLGCSVFMGQIERPNLPLEPTIPGQLACTPGAPANPLPVSAPDLSVGPTFTPYDLPPELQNAKWVRSAMEEKYPLDLKNDWKGGTAEIAIYVCDRGTVRAAVLRKSSGHERLDVAALAVAQKMAFAPAKYQGNSVGIWVTYPIVFKPGL
jgi:TonB family protein